VALVTDKVVLVSGAAQKLQRQWIGIGISPTAVGLMERRVKKAGATRVKLVGMPVTEEQPRALRPFEFQNWVIQRLNGTHSPRKSGDVGIDGYTFFFHDPIQVKQSERVGRNVVDNFETAIERNRSTAGTVVAFSFTRGAYEETARAKAAKGLDITLTTVQQLLTSDLADPVTRTSPHSSPAMPNCHSRRAAPSRERGQEVVKGQGDLNVCLPELKSAVGANGDVRREDLASRLCCPANRPGRKSGLYRVPLRIQCLPI